jgi:hypothetical protein
MKKHECTITERMNAMGRTDVVVICRKCGIVDKALGHEMARGVKGIHERKG